MKDDDHFLKISKEPPQSKWVRAGGLLFNLVEGLVWLLIGIIGLLGAIFSGLASFISGDH